MARFWCMLWGRCSLSMQLEIFAPSLHDLDRFNSMVQICRCISYWNGPIPASFSFIFGLYNQIIQKIFPVSCAGIWTHNLFIMSLLPLPQDQGAILFLSSNNSSKSSCNFVKLRVPSPFNLFPIDRSMQLNVEAECWMFCWQMFV